MINKIYLLLTSHINKHIDFYFKCSVVIAVIMFIILILLSIKNTIEFVNQN